MELYHRDYSREVVSRVAALNGSLQIRNLGDIVFERRHSYPFYSVVLDNRAEKNVFLSAGIHGDEPAGVYALLDFLEKRIYQYADRFNFVIFPCLNPSGFERKRRYNANSIELNNEFQTHAPQKEIAIIKKFLPENFAHYAFSISMHEDNVDEAVDGFSVDENPKDFYIIQISEDGLTGQRIIKMLEEKNISICKLDMIYGEKNNDGVVTELPDSYSGTLEEYLKNYTRQVFTTETPTTWPLERRIEVQTLALLAALDEFAGTEEREINMNK